MIKWNGKRGCIAHFNAFDHLAATGKCGNIFFHLGDVEDDKIMEGGMVIEFFIYVYKNGVGSGRRTQTEDGGEGEVATFTSRHAPPWRPLFPSMSR